MELSIIELLFTCAECTAIKFVHQAVSLLIELGDDELLEDVVPYRPSVNSPVVKNF